MAKKIGIVTLNEYDINNRTIRAIFDAVPTRSEAGFAPFVYVEEDSNMVLYISTEDGYKTDEYLCNL